MNRFFSRNFNGEEPRPTSCALTSTAKNETKSPASNGVARMLAVEWRGYNTLEERDKLWRWSKHPQGKSPLESPLEKVKRNP